MRRHAKASSAGSTSTTESGGLSQRRFETLALASVLFLALFLTSSALAAKEVVDHFGGNSGSGTLGGQFNSPRDVAVNKTGAGPANPGDVYVADDLNHRIQRFDKFGNFVSAWGANVVQAGKPGDVAGTNPYEVCVVAADCQAGTASGGNGAAAGNGSFDNPQSVAVDGDTGKVFVSDRDNRRVSVYDGAGVFIASFGFDVEVGGVATYEVCGDVVGDVCKAGVGGTGLGQYSAGATNSGYGIAVSQPDANAATGTVFLANTGGQRVTTYNLDGTSPASFGSATNFGTTQPRKIAVDSRGIVYASDSTNAAEIDRYDSLNANGGGIGFLTSIASPPLLAGTAATATSGLAVDPDSDGAGADEDVLYVLRDPTSGNTLVQQFGPVNDPGLSAPPAAVDDTHGNGIGFGTVNGLGVDDVSSRLYVGANGPSAHRVFVIADPLPAPTSSIDPVAAKTDTTATFSGAVDPKGGRVACDFEHSTDQVTWTPVAVPSCDSLPANGGAQPIGQVATGLVPNTHYFVRLSVRRPLVPNSTVVNPTVRTFDTDAVPPVVTDVGAVEVCDASARLVGTIDPRNAATAYEFRYGTTPALGTETAPVNVGSGATEVTVSQVVGGLAPDTTYYFALVATSTIGSTPSATQQLTTRAVACAPPDERGYEQVSPVDKGGSSVTSAAELHYRLTVAENGEAVGLCSSMLLGAQMGNVCGNYIMQRTDGGWQTKSPIPQVCGQDLEGTEFNTGANPEISYSPNLDRAAISVPETAACSLPLLDPAAPTPSKNLYRADLLGADFDLLNPEPSASNSGFNDQSAGLFGGANKNFSHVVYQSSGNQSGTAAPQPGSCPATPSTCRRDLFEWDGGTIHLVSRDTSNAPLTTSAALAGRIENNNIYGYNQISDDGVRIFFQSSPPTVVNMQSGTIAASTRLFMREGGSVTHDLSQSECTSSCGTASGELFQWAAEDGSNALFLSREKLVDGDDTSTAGNDLYMWRQSADPAADPNLFLLTRDQEPADGTVAAYEGTLGMSDDGNVVYFVAGGQIVDGGPTAAGAKVYRWVWNDGTPIVQYLATLDSNVDVPIWRYIDQFPITMVRRVNPNGAYLLVDTVIKLDPVADRDGDRDVYRWSEGPGWLCLSCQLPGAISAGGSAIHGSATRFEGEVDDNDQNPRRQDGEPVTLSSDDGQRVFFVSRDRLVPDDTNVVQDVYQWHDGTVSLISSGIGTEKSTLVGSSRDGDDVFFLTAQRLVGWDDDKAVDLYDARVGGGFPEPLPDGVPCEGAGCRGASSTPIPSTGAGTAALEGPGDSKPVKPFSCPRGKRKMKVGGRMVCKKQKKKHGKKRRGNLTRKAG